MKDKLWVILFLGLVILLSACGGSGAEAPAEGAGSEPGRQVAVAGGAYRDVSAAELDGMLKDKDFTFVNVHIPFEGDIPGTDLSFPFNEVEQNLDQLPQDQDAKIVLYCRSDRMSRIAAEEMVRLGYTNIWNLDGGMVAWEKAGLPIER